MNIIVPTLSLITAQCFPFDWINIKQKLAVLTHFAGFLDHCCWPHQVTPLSNNKKWDLLNTTNVNNNTLVYGIRIWHRPLTFSSSKHTNDSCSTCYNNNYGPKLKPNKSYRCLTEKKKKNIRYYGSSILEPYRHFTHP